MASVDNIYKLDGRVPVGKAIPFGLQHVLAMFVANVTPVLLIASVAVYNGQAFTAIDTALLIQAAMLVAGIGTLVQLFPVWRIGSKLPVVMGLSFTFLSAMMTLAAKDYGLMIGAVIVGAGVQGVNFFAVLTKVLIPALISPVIAGLASFIAVKLIYLVVRKLDEKYVEDGFRHGQTITACLVALSHGTNDAQKTMGIITLTLIAVGAQASGTGPQLWVVFICGFAIALGTYTGGWRVIRTLGKGLTEINTPQGFAAEASSAATILVSSHLGFALSTTQVCSGSIIGTGLGKRGNKVNWGVAGRMVIAWLVTFPASGLVGAAACALARTGMGGTVAVAIIGLGVALVIFRLSKRNPINSANVNESPDVRLTPKQGGGNAVSATAA